MTIVQSAKLKRVRDTNPGEMLLIARSELVSISLGQIADDDHRTNLLVLGKFNRGNVANDAAAFKVKRWDYPEDECISLGNKFVIDYEIDAEGNPASIGNIYLTINSYPILISDKGPINLIDWTLARDVPDRRHPVSSWRLWRSEAERTSGNHQPIFEFPAPVN